MITGYTYWSAYTQLRVWSKTLPRRGYSDVTECVFENGQHTLRKSNASAPA